MTTFREDGHDAIRIDPDALIARSIDRIQLNDISDGIPHNHPHRKDLLIALSSSSRGGRSRGSTECWFGKLAERANDEVPQPSSGQWWKVLNQVAHFGYAYSEKLTAVCFNAKDFVDAVFISEKWTLHCKKFISSAGVFGSVVDPSEAELVVLIGREGCGCKATAFIGDVIASPSNVTEKSLLEAAKEAVAIALVGSGPNPVMEIAVCMRNETPKHVSDAIQSAVSMVKIAVPKDVVSLPFGIHNDETVQELASRVAIFAASIHTDANKLLMEVAKAVTKHPNVNCVSLRADRDPSRQMTAEEFDELRDQCVSRPAIVTIGNRSHAYHYDENLVGRLHYEMVVKAAMEHHAGQSFIHADAEISVLNSTAFRKVLVAAMAICDIEDDPDCTHHETDGASRLDAKWRVLEATQAAVRHFAADECDKATGCGTLTIGSMTETISRVEPTCGSFLKRVAKMIGVDSNDYAISVNRYWY
jgi:hypothetical protein